LSDEKVGPLWQKFLFKQKHKQGNMPTFLSCTELYETIQNKSKTTTELLWVCSPSVGSNAHKIFSQEILSNAITDVKLIFQLNEAAIKRRETNPYEVQYFMEHFKENNVKSHDNFHSNIYIFDNSAIMTSADLTEPAFESNIEAGVMLEGAEVDEVKRFFDLNLWRNAKAIGDLKKFKKLWNLTEETFGKKSPLKKTKPHTKIKDWTNDYANTWYFGLLAQLSAKTERKIRKDNNWPANLLLIGDIGYSQFKQLKLADKTYLAKLYRKRGDIEIVLARIFDKSRVETDEGDLHFVCQIEKKYALERQKFFELLKNANIHSKSSEVMLNGEQSKYIVDVLTSIRHRRKIKK
jgi:hypothetical protein